MIRTNKYKDQFVRLLKIIEEQGTFGFTGKVNVLLHENNQFIGSIYQLNGTIVNAFYNGQYGIKSFYNLFFSLSNGGEYKFIPEPEIIEEGNMTFEIDVREILPLVTSFMSKSQDALKLRPPNNAKLMIDGEFIIKGCKVDSNEFETLKTLSDFSLVSDVYDNCQLLDYEVTNSLVSLRRSGALKVIS